MGDDGAVEPSHSWEPEDEEDYEAANAELKTRFAAWADNKGLEIALGETQVWCRGLTIGIRNGEGYREIWIIS